ncbi:MAG TPA: aldo/keto reductase [Ignavibacteriaceae bacterium]|nr:aldo/keto reductase [Ignavibacteriaceae bacterium]
MTIDSTIKLNNNIEIPRLGFGVYLAKPGKETFNAVTWALEAGYRHIDTARAYKNEGEVGKAIKESSIKREDVFVTTKLWNQDQGYESALKAFDASLDDLGFEYVDLYLIHWPVEGKRRESWRALEKIYSEGRAKSIGVSNYTIKHLKEMDGYTAIKPVINQVEFHPFLYQEDLLEYCKIKEVRLEAYSPLARAEKLDNPDINEMAKKYSKSAAQIMIKWSLQHDLVVIPKSVHKERIKENADVFDFEIAENDMEKLNSLNEELRIAWDPTHVD